MVVEWFSHVKDLVEGLVDRDPNMVELGEAPVTLDLTELRPGWGTTCLP